MLNFGLLGRKRSFPRSGLLVLSNGYTFYSDDDLFLRSSVKSNHSKCFGYAGTFDGTAYLAASHLDGTESVVDSIGTSTPTVSSGRIDFDAGWCSLVQLDNGDIFIIQSTSTSEQTAVYNITTGRHATLTSASTPFFTTGREEATYLIGYGWNESGSNIIPASAATVAYHNEFDSEDGLTVGGAWSFDGGSISINAVGAAGAILFEAYFPVAGTYTAILNVSAFTDGGVRVIGGDGDLPEYATAAGFQQFDFQVDSAGTKTVYIQANLASTLEVESILMLLPASEIPGPGVITTDVFGNSLSSMPNTFAAIGAGYIQMPADAELIAADDGTLFTDSNPNNLTLSDLEAMAGDQFFYEETRYLGIYDEDLTGAPLVQADRFWLID